MSLTVMGERAAGASTRLLRVDQNDPFFFDHPLDHVPGMLLVAGLLDLVREQADDAGTGRLGISLSFANLCELDEPTRLLAAEQHPGPGAGARTWTLRATQRDRLACEGHAIVHRDTMAVPADAGAAEPAVEPAEADLVHRARPENVLIGAPEQAGGEFRTAVLRPPSGSFLHRQGDGGYGVETLVEAGRQLATLFAHTVAGHPLGTQLLWGQLDAELPWILPGTARLALRSRPDPAEGRRMRYRADVIGMSDERVHGTVGYDCRAVTAASFRRFRAGTTASQLTGRAA